MRRHSLPTPHVLHPPSQPPCLPYQNRSSPQKTTTLAYQMHSNHKFCPKPHNLLASSSTTTNFPSDTALWNIIQILGAVNLAVSVLDNA